MVAVRFPAGALSFFSSLQVTEDFGFHSASTGSFVPEHGQRIEVMTPSVKFKVNGLFPLSPFRFRAVPLGHGDKVTFPLCRRRNRKIYESIKFLTRKFENFF
jgi:hypothetical protein